MSIKVPDTNTRTHLMEKHQAKLIHFQILVNWRCSSIYVYLKLFHGIASNHSASFEAISAVLALKVHQTKKT